MGRSKRELENIRKDVRLASIIHVNSLLLTPTPISLNVPIFYSQGVSNFHQQRKDSKWEILTSLEQGTSYAIKPKPWEGFLSKRRKWPLKGMFRSFLPITSSYQYKQLHERPW